MKKNLRKRQIILFIGDLACFFVSLIITLIFGFGKELNWIILSHHFLAFSSLLPLWFFIFFLSNLYELKILTQKDKIFLYVIFQAPVIIISGAIFFYLFPLFGLTPKTNLVVFALLFTIFLLSWRLIFRKISSLYFKKNVLLIGKSNALKKLKETINENPSFGYKVVKTLPEFSANNLSKTINQEKIQLIILDKSSFLKDVYSQLYQFFLKEIEVWTIIEAYEIIFRKIPLECIDEEWLIENIKEKTVFERIKRVLDVIIGLLILLTSSFLWLLIGIAIKLEDRGPIFYTQKRIGKNKKSFVLIKFRSMIPNAEKKKPVWAKEDDPRITKVGKFLRKTHLDELPQMLNVIKGDISLVGPRPERPEFVEKLEKEIPYYHLRHIIKPGFTGWAQIKFRYARSVIDSLEKFEYDLYYLKNRSFFLYFYIILKTAALFFRE